VDPRPNAPAIASWGPETEQTSYEEPAAPVQQQSSELSGGYANSAPVTVPPVYEDAAIQSNAPAWDPAPVEQQQGQQYIDEPQQVLEQSWGEQGPSQYDGPAQQAPQQIWEEQPQKVAQQSYDGPAQQVQQQVWEEQPQEVIQQSYDGPVQQVQQQIWEDQPLEGPQQSYEGPAQQVQQQVWDDQPSWSGPPQQEGAIYQEDFPQSFEAQQYGESQQEQYAVKQDESVPQEAANDFGGADGYGARIRPRGALQDRQF